MSHVYEDAAIRIMDWFHHAERDLIGAPVVTFNGETGTVRELKLDEHHGLCFTIDMQGPARWFPVRWYPVSTIKHKGPAPYPLEKPVAKTAPQDPDPYRTIRGLYPISRAVPPRAETLPGCIYGYGRKLPPECSYPNCTCMEEHGSNCPGGPP